MTVIYRAVLEDPREDLAEVADEAFTGWLGTKDEKVLQNLPVGLAVTPDDGRWLARHDQGEQGGTDVHRWMFSERTPKGVWTVTLATFRLPPIGAIRPQRLFAELDHQGRLEDRATTIAPPRVVGALLDQAPAQAAGLNLTTEAIGRGAVNGLVAELTDPRRLNPIVVLTRAPGEDDNSLERLRAWLSRGLAGVAALRVIERSAQASFDAALPGRLRVYGGAARLYLPGTTLEEAGPGTPLFTGDFLRRGTRGRQRILELAWQRATARPIPPQLADVLRVLPPARPLASTETTPEDALRDSWAQALLQIQWRDRAEHVSKLESALQQVLETSAGPAQGKSDLEEQVARLNGEVESLAEQLTAAEAESLDYLKQIYTAQQERDTAHQERAEAEERLELAELEAAEQSTLAAENARRVTWLESQLSAEGTYLTGKATPDEQGWGQTPSTCFDVLVAAEQRLDRLRIVADVEQAAYLDTFPKAGAWATKAWKALCCLQEYAQARADGSWTQPFRAWLVGSAEHGGNVVPDSWWAAVESDSVTKSTSYSAARTFKAGELGDVYMQAHVKIEPGGRPAPRIHLHDDTAGSTGLVWVGYFGAHLPNDQTN